MPKLFRTFFLTVLFAPENEGGDGAAPVDPGTVLFPNDKPAESGDDGNAKPEETKPEGDKAPADWKEYVADPNKSEAENATAKAEHDKTKPAEKGDDKGAADEVPKDGKYDLKLPDGVELDTELMAVLGPKFSELKLTNSQAQQLAEAYTKTLQDRSQKAGNDWAGIVSKWVDDAKSDPTIGGDNWDATVAASTRAVNKLGTPELKEYLNASGGGNHPELIRFMSKVGAMIREDNPARGGTDGSSKPADAAHVLFPNDVPKG